MDHSKIQWVTKQYSDGTIVPGYTFNEWEGCLKVSPACANCYAETRNIRFYGGKHWGPFPVERRLLAQQTRNNLKRWHNKAEVEDNRPFVFCSSLSDVLEDHPQVNEWRPELIEKMIKYDHLDYLVLTKRPENAKRFFPQSWLDGQWPNHIWFGCSIEDEEWAAKRLPHMKAIPALHKFVSYEPALGRIDWQPWTGVIDWLIAGGESGTKARISQVEWFEDAVAWALANDVEFHFKQWGQWVPEAWSVHPFEVQRVEDIGTHTYLRAGNKYAAGRVIFGKTWDYFPGYDQQPPTARRDHSADSVVKLPTKRAESRKFGG